MEDEILWVGFLKGESKRNALADADIFVLSSYSENFGVAVVEAMGAGLPVIVSDQVGLHRDISIAGAGLVVECSVPSLESALTTLVEDRVLRSNMASKCSADGPAFRASRDRSAIRECVLRDPES